MAKYYIEVEAIQYDGDDEALIEWIKSREEGQFKSVKRYSNNEKIEIEFESGVAEIDKGDYFTQYPDNSYSIFEEEVFQRNFKVASDE